MDLTNNPEVNLIYSKGKNIQNLERQMPLFPSTERIINPENTIIFETKVKLIQNAMGQWRRTKGRHSLLSPFSSRLIATAVCIVSSYRAWTMSASLP